MKKTLLFTFFVCLFAFAAHAQATGECEGCDTDDYHSSKNVTTAQTATKKKKISVYPNPAVDFIGLSDDQNVNKIVIYNVMGKEEKSFLVEKGMKYDVTDLKRGMYLVQILDYRSKVITTQRLNKN